MNHKFYSTSAAVVVLLGAAGCGSAPVRIDTASNQGITTVHQIDFKDWQIAAEKGINSMLESGAMKRADGRKTILMISNVKNSTTESVNTRILTDKIRQAVLRSGQAVVTTAVGAKGAEETAVRQVRELENDDLFNQSTVQKRGTVIAPDMSLSGEIVQQQTLGADRGVLLLHPHGSDGSCHRACHVGGQCGNRETGNQIHLRLKSFQYSSGMPFIQEN